MSAVAALGVAAPASASTITFTLDCTLVDATTCTAGGNFGTVTLTDNGNSIDVTVDTASNQGTRALALNWYTNTDPGGVWSATGSDVTAITFAVDAANPFGRFDIQMLDGTAPYADPLTFTLSNSLLNLDVNNFLVKDDQNQIYAGVVVLSGQSTPDFFRYGATTATVPEPAVLTLIGLGLLGCARRVRRGKGKLA